MTLSAGDLTTLVRVQNWMAVTGTDSVSFLNVAISSMSTMIYNKLNRQRLYSQTVSRIFEAVGNYQLILPDYPVTAVTAVQVGPVAINPYPLPTPGQVLPPNTFGYGYRVNLWSGELPGDPSMVEFVNGGFPYGVQNVKVTYTTGYAEFNEPHTVPATPGPYTITVNQPQGIWCRDGGVTYASSGVALVPVSGTPLVGQYVPPADPPATLATLGTYTFAAADQAEAVLISYSFVPSDLEEATIQMVAERFGYRSRVGQIDKTLGGQETIRYLRGGIGRHQTFDLPPEVEAMIWPYISVLYPRTGAPV
jgi:hypothetical protein